MKISHFIKNNIGDEREEDKQVSNYHYNCKESTIMHKLQKNNQPPPPPENISLFCESVVSKPVLQYFTVLGTHAQRRTQTSPDRAMSRPARDHQPPRSHAGILPQLCAQALISSEPGLINLDAASHQLQLQRCQEHNPGAAMLCGCTQPATLLLCIQVSALSS